ncbi:MAG: CDP-diacylglycerol--serine O-phosphatidyltransferase [Candidatus Riflebacteria bacterium]|nr:CDP-diacylglycerol--serine O-phosphatidyltransferase [Candidatus Riflebacteria bacterium]
MQEEKNNDGSFTKPPESTISQPISLQSGTVANSQMPSDQSAAVSTVAINASPSPKPNKLRHLSVLPNVCTSLNLLCGYLSIIFSSREEFLAAGWIIVLAVIFDILDGRIARLTSVTSKFGAELDSLADLVSFGVAPAFLVFNRYLSDYRLIGLFSTSLFVLCGALRLARFNITPPSDKDVFTGLPIPAGAGILCTLTIFEMQFFTLFKIPDSIIPIIVIITSFLMVSTIEYPALKKSPKTSNQRKFIVLIFVFSLVLIPPVALFLYSWGFALYGLFVWFFRKLGGLLKKKTSVPSTLPSI